MVAAPLRLISVASALARLENASLRLPIVTMYIVIPLHHLSKTPRPIAPLQSRMRSAKQGWPARCSFAQLHELRFDNTLVHVPHNDRASRIDHNVVTTLCRELPTVALKDDIHLNCSVLRLQPCTDHAALSNHVSVKANINALDPIAHGRSMCFARQIAHDDPLVIP